MRQRILAAIDATSTAAASAEGHAEGHASRDIQGLIEPLSERELDVLRLLRSELSGPEIARELFVSLNTVRTHTKSIFTKMGVKPLPPVVGWEAQ